MSIDVIVIIAYLYLETGVLVRGLHDFCFSKFIGLKHGLEYFGAISGTRENTALAMSTGAPLLVFPGGSYEYFRDPREHKYELIWRNRKGFARIAAEHGYDIVPLACVGFEDMMTVAFSFPANYLWAAIKDPRALKKIDTTMPRFEDGSPNVPEKIPIFLPYISLQDVFMTFGKPISTSGLDAKDDEQMTLLARKAKTSLEAGLEESRGRQAAVTCSSNRFYLFFSLVFVGIVLYYFLQS